MFNISVLFLSHPLDESTPAFAGGQGFSGSTLNSIAAGDHINTSCWQFPNHTGTHLDAPAHFFKDEPTIDSYDPAFWIFGAVTLLEVDPMVPVIGPAEILPRLGGSPELLLIKTGMTRFRAEDRYWQDYPGLSPQLAEELKNAFPTLRLVGLDTISVSSLRNRDQGRAAHRAFLSSENGGSILLLEDMDLSPVDATTCFTRVVVAPLLVKAADGAPCTVIAETA